MVCLSEIAIQQLTMGTRAGFIFPFPLKNVTHKLIIYFILQRWIYNALCCVWCRENQRPCIVHCKTTCVMCFGGTHVCLWGWGRIDKSQRQRWIGTIYYWSYNLHIHDYAWCPPPPPPNKMSFHYRWALSESTVSAGEVEPLSVVWTQSGEWHCISITSVSNLHSWVELISILSVVLLWYSESEMYRPGICWYSTPNQRWLYMLLWPS